MTRGVAHIKATFNNTMVTITDTNGETLSWASAGTVNFRLSFRKSCSWSATIGADAGAAGFVAGWAQAGDAKAAVVDTRRTRIDRITTPPKGNEQSTQRLMLAEATNERGDPRTRVARYIGSAATVSS